MDYNHHKNLKKGIYPFVQSQGSERTGGGAELLPRVIFDANFLMLPFQFRINLDMELVRTVGAFEGIVLKPVLNELHGIARESGKEGVAARGAIRFAEHYILVETPEPEADEAIINFVSENKGMNTIVATNDRELRMKLKGMAKFLILRGKSHLELVE